MVFADEPFHFFGDDVEVSGDDFIYDFGDGRECSFIKPVFVALSFDEKPEGRFAFWDDFGE